jgi:DNA-directed RNA polymerase
MLQASWQPGDDPTTHPFWEKQVALEQHMLRAGADRFKAHVNKAREKGRMSGLTTHRRLIRDWLPLMVEGIQDYIRDARSYQRRMGGVAPVALQYLEDMDKYLAAYVTLRFVVDHIAAKNHGNLLSLEAAIGSALEHEARMLEWERRDPKLYYGVRRSLKRQHATSEHRRRVNINRFNKLMMEKLEWAPWPLNHRRRIGEALIDILCRYTGQFAVGPDPTFKYSTSSRVAVKSPPIALQAKPELVKWLLQAADRAELMSPVYLPTVIPPKRWKGTRDGAYYTDYVKPPSLIRFKAYQEDQASGAADEYDAVDMPQVYTALNVIQEVPWRVHDRVLEVALWAWEKDLAIAGLPRQEAEPLPPEAPEDADEDTIKQAKRARTLIRSRNARRISEVIATERTLSIAKRFLSETFYFPHRIDFRGRMYPIPVDLQPQGRDLARGLLTFEEGKPVDMKSSGWLAIHLANQFGQDKITMGERIDWVEERRELWFRIADDPKANREWADADAPWQALAAVFEWVGFLEHGEGFVSHLPIRVDGTCNGLQHLSAATRDKVGGQAVNLVPGPRPNDIYQQVADRLSERLWEIEAGGGEEGDKARWWLDLCEGKLKRGLTKRPVMILPYGGTQDAFFRYIQDWLEEEHEATYNALGPKEAGKLCAFMKKHTWDAVGDTVSGAMEVMNWIKDCARKAARESQPLYWKAPSGFMVRHFYGKMKMRRIKQRIDGQSFNIAYHEPTKELDIESQLRGISPNFIHSLDAATNTIALCKSRDAGITSVTSIHDAFGGLAADMWPISDIIREAFVETHRVDMLAEFRSSCQTVLADHIELVERASKGAAWSRADKLLPKPLGLGELDLEGVLESDYFFA